MPRKTTVKKTKKVTSVRVSNRSNNRTVRMGNSTVRISIGSGAEPAVRPTYTPIQLSPPAYLPPQLQPAAPLDIGQLAREIAALRANAAPVVAAAAPAAAAAAPAAEPARRVDAGAGPRTPVRREERAASPRTPVRREERAASPLRSAAEPATDSPRSELNSVLDLIMRNSPAPAAAEVAVEEARSARNRVSFASPLLASASAQKRPDFARREEAEEELAEMRGAASSSPAAAAAAADSGYDTEAGEGAASSEAGVRQVRRADGVGLAGPAESGRNLYIDGDTELEIFDAMRRAYGPRSYGEPTAEDKALLQRVRTLPATIKSQLQYLERKRNGAGLIGEELARVNELILQRQTFERIKSLKEDLKKEKKLEAEREQQRRERQASRRRRNGDAEEENDSN